MMGRCECGRLLEPTIVQFHQKLGGVLVLVCSASFKLPEECDQATVVKLKKIHKMEDETYDVWVWGKRVGVVGVLKDRSRGWIWVADTETGIEKTRDSAVKVLLRRSES